MNTRLDSSLMRAMEGWMRPDELESWIGFMPAALQNGIRPAYAFGVSPGEDGHSGRQATDDLDWFLDTLDNISIRA